MASRATAKNIVPVYKTDDANFESDFARLVNRRTQDVEDVDETVHAIIERVRGGGHEELVACVKEFDGSDIDALEVTREEWDEAAEDIDPADRAVNRLQRPKLVSLKHSSWGIAPGIFIDPLRLIA